MGGDMAGSDQLAGKIPMLLVAFISAGCFVAPVSADSDHNPRPDDAPNTSSAVPYQEISPKDKALIFQQVRFEFDFGQAENTDWGRLEVYPSKLKKYSGGCEGYVNVWVTTPFLEDPQRVIADLYIPATHEDGHACSLEDPVLRMEREDDGTSGPEIEIPHTRFLDLRPGEHGAGPLPELEVYAVFSRQPAAHRLNDISFSFDYVDPARYRVDPTPYNSQGGFTFLPGNDPLPPPDSTPSDFVDMGPPPPVVAIPLDINDLSFPLIAHQSGNPNIQAAKNQCFPIAVANVLGFLEATYDSEQILNWELPHLRSARGIGQAMLAGDVEFFEPVPDYSLVANVDTYTRRKNVADADTGEGTTGCTLFYGIFGYLSAFGEQSPIVFRHQEGSDIIDPDALPGCTPPPFDVTEQVSTREGTNVTWDWIYEQLSKGRGVFVGVTWFKNGEAVGGHGMRVRTASRINGHDYLTFVNDSQQGSGFGGLEYWTVEVSDVRGPVLQVVPNGKLELDKGQHEINFAMSFEALPTLAIF
jgi:hypothetical protein